MEGVGSRLGRSSTRYGPAAVFSGPVRKWKKRWIHVSASNAANHAPQSNGINGNNGSHLVLYKWTPMSQSSNSNNGNSNGEKISGKDDSTAAPEEPPRRKFKYIPIAVLEEQKKEAEEKVDDETKTTDADPSGTGPTSMGDDFDGKPDINDMPMEEIQALDKDQSAQHDLNESNLDLSLGLKAHEGDRDSDPTAEDRSKDVEKMS